jgi:hypothetical protein
MIIHDRPVRERPWDRPMHEIRQAIDYVISTKTLAKSTLVRLFSRPRKAL